VVAGMSINSRSCRSDAVVRSGIAARLAEIKARADNATDGPWVAGHRSSLDWLSQSPAIDNDGHEPGSAVGQADATDPLWGSLWPSRNATADAEFIASARTDLPALVNAVESVLDYVDRCEESGITMQPGDIRRLIAAALGGAS